MRQPSGNSQLEQTCKLTKYSVDGTIKERNTKYSGNPVTGKLWGYQGEKTSQRKRCLHWIQLDESE